MITIDQLQNRIICADCLDILRRLPDKCVDLVLTDPPYELDTHGGGNRKQWKNIHNNFIKDLSFGFDYEQIFNEFIRICKTPNILIFCSNKQISKIMTFFENKKLSTTLLCWHKKGYIPFANGKHISDIEFIIYVRGKNAHWNNDIEVYQKSKILEDNWRIKNKIHPTEKSVEVIEHLIKLHSYEKDLILDCFSGSGTTAIACHNLKRRFICIERDKEYCEASIKRLEEAQQQQTLF